MVGLVNIGHEVTNVNILEDGIPVLTRDLSVGTRRFREDLQREKGLSGEDAERAIQGATQSADLAGYVDARGEEIEFQILHWRKAGYVPAPTEQGWHISRIFGGLFKITRKRHRRGDWRYTLATKSN